MCYLISQKFEKLLCNTMVIAWVGYEYNDESVK